MTTEELLKAAEKALEDSVDVDNDAKLIINESVTNEKLIAVANTITIGAMYFAIKSQAYSQLAQARMQYEAHVPWREREL